MSTEDVNTYTTYFSPETVTTLDDVISSEQMSTSTADDISTETVSPQNDVVETSSAADVDICSEDMTSAGVETVSVETPSDVDVDM
jgi:hypothetical protein